MVAAVAVLGLPTEVNQELENSGTRGSPACVRAVNDWMQWKSAPRRSGAFALRGIRSRRIRGVFAGRA